MASAQPLAGAVICPPKALDRSSACMSQSRATGARERAPSMQPSTTRIWVLMVLTHSRMRLSPMVSGMPVMECQM